jgi:YgiT-type zinc finger domain-containing protein
MNRSKKNNAKEVIYCSLCDKPGVEAIRKDILYKGVQIENVPALRCPTCHNTYYDLKTVKLIEKIAKSPDRYAKMLKRPVARVA